MLLSGRVTNTVGFGEDHHSSHMGNDQAEWRLEQGGQIGCNAFSSHVGLHRTVIEPLTNEATTEKKQFCRLIGVCNSGVL